MSNQDVFILNNSGLHAEENKYKQPTHGILEMIRSFYVIHDNSTPRPSWPKMKAQPHGL